MIANRLPSSPGRSTGRAGPFARTALLVSVLAAAAAGCTKERTCAADQQLCGDTCVALQTDPASCGACGHACGAGQGCAAGACVDCVANPGACTPVVMAACGNLDQVRPLGADLTPAGPALPTESGPISFARAAGTLFVANSRSSSISAVTTDPLAGAGQPATIRIPVGGAQFADLEHVASHDGLLWVSNAAAGTLVAVSPAGAVVDEVPLAASQGEFVNPQGIDFVGTKGYLALAGVDALAVLDLARVPGASVRTRIPLAPLAYGAASAAPSRVLAVGSRVYVTLNDRFDASYVPVAGAHGRLAVIDSATDTLVGGPVDLGPECLNASGMALLGTTLWVACGALDLDPSTYAVVGVSGTALVPVETAGALPMRGTPVVVAGHAPMSVTFCDGRGYAGASDSGTVLAFDPATRAVTSALACPAQPGKSSYVPDVACAR